MNLRAFFSLAAAAIAIAASAEVTLPRVVSSGMVAQRGDSVKIWGKASPGETVDVAAKGLGKGKVKKYKALVSTFAAADSTWMVKLPPMPVGGPYTLTINDITIDNVLSGDVYICSGQSNMELPVARVTDMFADEIAAYENPNIRQFNVPSVVDFGRKNDDVPSGDWRELTQANVMQYSALAYFFAKELYERTGVPVGILNTCWGGTPVESWISEEWLGDYPMAINEMRLYSDPQYRQSIKRLEAQNYARWDQVMNAGDPGVGKWNDPALDDSQWTVVDLLSTDWATDGLNPVNGSHWFRKSLVLPAEAAGQPAVLRLGCIVDADSVFVNGQFVGNVTYQYPPRIYQVPAGLLREGDNNITIRMISQHGEGHFVPEKPYKLIVGDSEYSLEGDWRYHLGARMPEGPGQEFWCYKPTVLYNAMIHPFLNVNAAGAIWYQGESNVERRNQYAGLLKTMIANWREDFDNPDMPFYIVELADYLPFDDVEGRAAWAEMRQVQQQVADETENAYFIHNQDLGEWNDIHPLNKKTLGIRVVDAVMSR